jgi:hypothetical protein
MENNDFGVLDLPLARIVNGADCWPPEMMSKAVAEGP